MSLSISARVFDTAKNFIIETYKNKINPKISKFTPPKTKIPKIHVTSTNPTFIKRVKKKSDLP